MKFCEGHLLKHENCIDVAFYFIKYLGSDKEYNIFKGYWVNVSLMNPMIISKSLEEIKIKKEDMFKWKKYKHAYKDFGKGPPDNAS